MAVQEQITRILAVCKENGVAVSGKLSNVGVTGYASDGCQIFAEECIDRMEEYCRYGVNYGFGDVEEAIEELSRLAVAATDKKAEKKLSKAEETKRKIEAEIRLPRKGDVMQIKEEVYKYIDTSIAACDVLAGVRAAGTRGEILTKSSAKLAMLRTKIEDAFDGSSEKAAASAGKVIGHLKQWRNAAATLMLSETMLDCLDKALEEAETWGKLSASVKGGGIFSRDRRAKEDKIVKYQRDAISKIADSKRVRENIEIFRENLEAYKRDAEERYGVQSLLDKKKEYQEQIESLEREKREITAAQRNGEMDLEEALVRCRDEIDPEIADLREEILSLSSEITQRNAQRRDYDYLYRKLDAINSYIMSNSNDPAKLFVLGIAMDFNKLNNVMRGMANADEINHVIDLALANTYATAQEREGIVSLRGQLGAEVKELRDALRPKTDGISTGRTQADEEKRKAKIKAEADAYFKNETDKEEARLEEEKENGDKIKYVPISDDDK